MLQCDIYSLGMCIIENLIGEKYFPREGKALRLYVQKHIHGYSPSFMKTVMRMISHDPTKRPTIG
jgi:serine/threonine protein kinase